MNSPFTLVLNFFNKVKGWFVHVDVKDVNIHRIEQQTIVIINEAAKMQPSLANHVLDAMRYAGCKEIERQVVNKGDAKALKKNIDTSIAKQGSPQWFAFDAYIQREIAKPKAKLGKKKTK